jgi:hypothetical protein
VTPDGSILASAGEDKTVRLWSLPEGKLLATLTTHSKGVFALAVTADGAMLASAGADRTVALWSLPDGKLLNTFAGHKDEVYGLAFTPDGAVLASASEDGTVRLWSLPSGKPLATLSGHVDGVPSLALPPDGKRLFSGDGEGAVNAWDLPAGCFVSRFVASGEPEPQGGGGLEAMFANSPEDVQKAVMQALIALGFKIEDSGPEHVHGQRPPGMETARVWIEPAGEGRARVIVETDKSGFGVIFQKNWNDEILAQIEKNLGSQRTP